jgi:alanine racemase
MIVDAFYRPTWVEISLDAVQHNITAFQQKLPDSMKFMAVVKADAYGHGAAQVSKEAIRCGMEYLGVAFLDEALELRRAGIASPILVLGYTPPEGLAVALENDITVNVYSSEVLDALKVLSDQMVLQSSEQTVGTGDNDVQQTDRNAHGCTRLPGKRLKIHIKLDTGMGRIGLHTEQEAIAFIEEALQLPGIEVEGLFTHFAKADETDKTYTLEQYRRFERIVHAFKEKGVEFTYLHTGNSAVAIDMPEITGNMVRLGISMYGLYPSDEVHANAIDLKPVLSLKTAIVHLKTLSANSGVSYGAIYHTQQDEQIATLPIGYADGYSRMLTQKAEALIRGQRVPVVGKICMDQCMINVSAVEQAAVGDEVVLIGEQQGQRISVEEVAGWLGTVNYEITCMLSHRVPRIYMRNGKKVKTANPLLRSQN